jgi:hypothetical protein
MIYHIIYVTIITTCITTQTLPVQPGLVFQLVLPQQLHLHLHVTHGHLPAMAYGNMPFNMLYSMSEDMLYTVMTITVQPGLVLQFVLPQQLHLHLCMSHTDLPAIA